MDHLSDVSTSNQLLAASYLYKRSGKTHQWKKVWVSLRRCQLSYYKDSSEHKPIYVVHRNELQSFSKICDSEMWHFGVYTRQKVVHFKCKDSNEFNLWMHSLAVFFHQDDSDQHTHVQSEKTEHGEQPVEQDDLADISELPDPSSAVCAGPEHTIHQGDMSCLQKRYRKWKKFHSVLTNRALYLNKKDTLYKLIPMSEIVDVIEWDSSLKMWCFLIITVSKRFRVSVETEKEMDNWMSKLRLAKGEWEA